MNQIFQGESQAPANEPRKQGSLWGIQTKTFLPSNISLVKTEIMKVKFQVVLTVRFP